MKKSSAVWRIHLTCFPDD